jgi:serine/threonine protein kinase
VVSHPRDPSSKRASAAGEESAKIPLATDAAPSATLQVGLHAAPTHVRHDHAEVTFDNAMATWDVLAQYMEAFLTAWQGGLAPAMANYLPAAPPVLRKLTLVELIKLDLEHRYACRQERLLEDYVREFPELSESAGPPCDLIYEEYHVRKSHGHAVAPEDYFNRFPGRKSELSGLLGVKEHPPTAQLASPRSIQLKEGDQIDDFDLLARLGTGAFGAVFLARQRSISRLCALKVSADKGQEARTLAQLDHPHIVRVFDQRRLPDQQLRLVYMQLASGGTLADIVPRVREMLPVDRSGKILSETVGENNEKAGLGPVSDGGMLRLLSGLSWSEVVCRLGMQLALALDYAHRQGVLHRDIKPANILLAADGSPKLADFNISALASHPSAGASAYFGGSLAYMSPEHLEAFNPAHARQPEELDNRADLFSLAVVLWELLNGAKPFADARVENDWGLTLAQMTERRHRHELQKPTHANDEVARNLTEVLERALSPNPADRPQTGAELAQELSLCVQKETQRIVKIPKRGWRDWVRRWPTVAVLTVVTVPNLVAAVFNIVYNYSTVVQDNPEAKIAFDRIMPIINGIAFPVGAFIVCCYVWPVTTVVRNPKKIAKLTAEEASSLRRRSLYLGNIAAIIGIIEWAIAGIAWPIVMESLGGHMSLYHDVPHFFISLVFCGLFAASFPFLGVTYLAVRVLFPALLQRGVTDPSAEEDLVRVGKLAGIYFLIAEVVPMAGALIVLLAGDSRVSGWFLKSLVIISLACLPLVFYVYSIIRRDIAALAPILHPVENFGSESTISKSTARLG